MPATGPLPFLCVDMPAAFQGAVPAGTLAGPQSAQGVCTVTESGKVHLANVFEISKEANDTLMALQKDSLFVKRAAATLWSTEVDTIRVFFRHYARSRGWSDEAATKVEKNIRLWLSQKTCELRRKMPAASN
ncbi:hypothetical protein V5799_002242 [Amblyomma americanum]|uniref:Uncharacterized protein n=1 Tax=Amblyomma americanum TaxID=6943 RepID=A0AAQ4CXW3_AMBAM